MKRIKIHDLLSDKKSLNQLCEDLKDGAIAVIPTDTLYGFAVSYDSEKAVNRVYEIKHRDGKKPLILFVTNIKDLKKLGLQLSPQAENCIQNNWPGALTVILPKPSKGKLSNFPFPSIGLRAPAHNELLQLLKKLLPIRLLTTSANRSGAPSDKDPDNIAKEFSEEIDWFIDDGILPSGVPSTVADFSTMPPKVLRQGKILIS